MNCNCLCDINHPKKTNICTGQGDRLVVFKGRFGRREVIMCDPCAEAAISYQNSKKR